MKLKGYFFAITSAVFYGLIPLFILPIKIAHVSVDLTLFFRFLLASLFILIYLILKKEQLTIHWRELFILLSLGLLYALSSDFLLIGYDLLTPGIASTILFAFPVIVAIIMATFFKERINWISIISIAISMAGIFALGVQSTLTSFNIRGLGVCMLSALFYALYIVVVNKSDLKISGMKLTFYSLLFSSLYYGCKLLLSKGSFMIPEPKLLMDLAMLSLVCTVLSLVTLVYAIKFIGSTSASIMSALEPIVAIGISVSFFGEQLTFNLIVGAFLIVFGVVINIISNSQRVA